jgi:hypothetical protein
MSNRPLIPKEMYANYPIDSSYSVIGLLGGDNGRFITHGISRTS